VINPPRRIGRRGPTAKEQLMKSQLDDVVDFLSSPTAIGRPVDELMEEVAKRWPTMTDFQAQRAAQLAAARLRNQAARDLREAAQLAKMRG
jgi:hypothetical protein